MRVFSFEFPPSSIHLLDERGLPSKRKENGFQAYNLCGFVLNCKNLAVEPGNPPSFLLEVGHAHASIHRYYKLHLHVMYSIYDLSTYCCSKRGRGVASIVARKNICNVRVTKISCGGNRKHKSSGESIGHNVYAS